MLVLSAVYGGPEQSCEDRGSHSSGRLSGPIVGHGGRLPARVPALIDFLADEVDLDDGPELLDTI
jgi:hypothetical protein